MMIRLKRDLTLPLAKVSSETGGWFEALEKGAIEQKG